MRLSRGPLLLLILGIAGIGWALWHAASGDERCATRCQEAGYPDARYTAPLAGKQARCHCMAADGTLVPMP